jgi:phenylacetic acid degradation operon negative regulatory protein
MSLDHSVKQQPHVESEDPASLAGVLGTNRDRTDPADSSRGLLMTVLGEYLLAGDGEAWTQSVIQALDLVGVRDKTARQTMARLHQQGRLAKLRVGRQTRWSLTADTRSILETGAKHIYGFGLTEQPWDQRWAVVLASVPEKDRNTRYRMSVRLRWAGFGTPGNGVWISPWTSREGEAAQVLRELDLPATSFVAEIGQLGDAAELAERAWDLPLLSDGYVRFLTETDRLLERVSDDRSAAGELTSLVHRWRQFPFADPDLPGELLPSNWPRADAARRFSELRAELLPGATRWWADTEAAHTPN